jgi:hypothetical protein
VLGDGIPTYAVVEVFPAFTTRRYVPGGGTGFNVVTILVAVLLTTDRFTPFKDTVIGVAANPVPRIVS